MFDNPNCPQFLITVCPWFFYCANPVKKKKSFSVTMSKARDIMLENAKFYSKSDNLNTFLNFIRKSESAKKNSALRTLNWFATNHTKIVDVNIHGRSIRLDYLQQLKAYQKEFFDPFRRNKRILWKWELNDESQTPTNFTWEYIEESKSKDKDLKTTKDNEIVTTIAQVNFFKWAINRGVLQYVKENMESIKETQSKYSKSKRKGTSKGTIVKGTPIANQTVQKVIIDF